MGSKHPKSAAQISAVSAFQSNHEGVNIGKIKRIDKIENKQTLRNASTFLFQ